MQCARAPPLSTPERGLCFVPVRVLEMSGSALERLSSETTDSSRSSPTCKYDRRGASLGRAVGSTGMAATATEQSAGWQDALREANASALRKWLASGRLLPSEASDVLDVSGELCGSNRLEGTQVVACQSLFPKELRTPRGASWLLLSQRPRNDARSTVPSYVDLLDSIGTSFARYKQLWEKIEQDIPRTFRGCDTVRHRVPPEALARVLLAVAVHNNQTYVQGMNLYAASFLHVLPEPEAFRLLVCLVEDYAPRYLQVNSVAGAYEGCRLAARTIQHVDQELATMLSGDPLGLERALLVHGFPAVLSFSLCIPPFEDAMPLLDWILAFGAHFGVVFVVARLRCAREQLLSRTVTVKEVLNPRKEQDAFRIPPAAIIRESLKIVAQLPAHLWQQLQKHPLDA